MRQNFFIILFIGCCRFIPVSAQDTTTINFSFNHMALSVKNVDSSVAFYKKVLQLQEITNRTQKPGIRWLSMGEGKELHLISIIKKPYRLNKAIHLSLATSNFDAFIDYLKALRIPFSNWEGASNSFTTRADGIHQVYFQDPDGYWIEINDIK